MIKRISRDSSVKATTNSINVYPASLVLITDPPMRPTGVAQTVRPSRPTGAAPTRVRHRELSVVYTLRRALCATVNTQTSVRHRSTGRVRRGRVIAEPQSGRPYTGRAEP